MFQVYDCIFVQALETQTVPESLREILTQLYDLIRLTVQDLALDLQMMLVCPKICHLSTNYWWDNFVPRLKFYVSRRICF
jgi:hypothetical protein